MKNLMVFVTFAICSTTCISLKFLKNKQSHIEPQLSESVAQIIKIFYKTKGSYFHIIKSTENSNENLFNDVITEVLKKVGEAEIASMIENDENLKMFKDMKRFSVIIFLDSIESFNKFFLEVSGANFKLRRFFTLVLIKSLDLVELEMIFDSFWNMFIMNVNIIMTSDTGDVDLFTFIPFNDQKCGDTKPVKTNSFDYNQMKWRSSEIHLKKTRNLHKCPIVVGAGVGSAEPYLMVRKDSKGFEEIYGIERTFFDELSMKLNFTPKYEIHGNYPGSVFLNGTAVGKL